MSSPTREQLVDALEPLAMLATDSGDPIVVKAGVVLAALAGCLISPMEVEDRVALDHLAMLAGTLSQHRLGQHA